MPFVLPDFKGTRCLWIVAHGELETDDEAALGPIKRIGKTIIAPYKAGEVDAMLRLEQAREIERYIYLYVFKKEMFREDSNVEVRPLEEITSYLDLLKGKK